MTLVGFVLTNLNLLIQSNDSEFDDGGSGIQIMDRQNNIVSFIDVKNESLDSKVSQPTNASQVAQAKVELNKPTMSNQNETVLKSKPRSDTSSVPNIVPSLSNHSSIKQYITHINSEQKVWNLERYDLRAGSETVVIVVQVHNRADYLRYLVDSLNKARHIEKTLLIFSHDYFDPEIEEIVHGITFCPVMQIYFPYPMQIYPKEFPGEDPNDCPRDAKKEEALKRGCNNAEHPDKYGHYREARFAQTKHHWFWKINRVFDHLVVMQHHTGPVLLLEEDHYVTPDIIHTLLLMSKLKTEACHECRIMTLGSYEKNPVYGSVTGRVDVLDWTSSKHNMGMALNRATWQLIKACAEQFCKFDDYNWDWSLQHVSMTCIPGRLKVMVMKSPRIYHIGECGVHHKGKNCDPQEKVSQIEELLHRNKDFLFPDRLTLNSAGRPTNRAPKPNGGWGDLRDHQMCIRFTQRDVHR